MTSSTYFKEGFPYSKRSIEAVASVEESLKLALKEKGLEYGTPVFIRILKEKSILQVWLAGEDSKFVHFKDYDICTFADSISKTRQCFFARKTNGKQLHRFAHCE